jgi:hypothetical protein
MSLRKPNIVVDGLSILRPELVGLAAFLCMTECPIYAYQRILAYAGEHGAIDDGCEESWLTYANRRKLAHAAFLEGQKLVVREDEPAITFHRIANGNGNHISLPPVSGGAPVHRLDPAGINGQTDPDEIPF